MGNGLDVRVGEGLGAVGENWGRQAKRNSETVCGDAVMRLGITSADCDGLWGNGNLDRDFE